MLEPGAIIGGKLRIERVIGQGGMGIVAIATHLPLDQRVAIKVMRDELAGDRETVERFLREARAVARLRSEHVCRVSDVGTLDSGAPYIVMELLEGLDLARLGPIPPTTAIDYVLQACIGLAEAHAQGIVHRDLKPANLFRTLRIDGTPLIKVLDFGIAKAPSAHGPALTHSAIVLGSPGFMSPEQLVSARDVDARTDVWALGIILYQLVSQRLPFPATQATELAVKVATEPPAPLDDLDPQLRAIIFRCLEKAPDRRYEDVAALAAALVPFGSASAAQSASIVATVLHGQPGTAATLPAMASAHASTIATGGPMSATVATGAPRSGEPIGTRAPVGTPGAPASAPVAAAARRSDRIVVVVVAVVGVAVAAIMLARRGPGPTTGATRGGDARAVAIVEPTVVLDASLAPQLLDGSRAPAPPDAAAERAAPAPGSAARSTRPVTATARVDQGAPDAALATRFTAAIAAHRCIEALALAQQLGRFLAEAGGCMASRQAAASALADPASEPWILAMAAEMAEHGQAGGPVIVDGMYQTRTIAACKSHEETRARRDFARIEDPARRESAAASCRAQQIELVGP